MTFAPGTQFFAEADGVVDGPARELTGYAGSPPRFLWPGDRNVAFQLVINVEEGSERSFPMGDGSNDSFHEFPGVLEDQRDLDIESVYEYGARAGIWRLLSIIEKTGTATTFFATAVALMRNPPLAAWIRASSHEVACHGYRWLNNFELDREQEREWIARTADAIDTSIGRRPTGWYSRQMSVNTRELLVEHGGFLYDSDSYNDDLPYWTQVHGHDHLVVPYTLVVNDAHFVLSPTFARPDDFWDLARQTIDRLASERDGTARMVSIGVHPRIAGQPARAAALERILDYANAHEDVWVARRVDVAQAFAGAVPAPSGGGAQQHDD